MIAPMPTGMLTGLEHAGFIARRGARLIQARPSSGLGNPYSTFPTIRLPSIARFSFCRPSAMATTIAAESQTSALVQPIKHWNYGCRACMRPPLRTPISSRRSLMDEWSAAASARPCISMYHRRFKNCQRGKGLRLSSPRRGH